MAIDISPFPGDYSPPIIGTHMDKVIRADSDQNTQPDFLYVVKISAFGLTFTGYPDLVFKIKPNPDDGYMYFNISQALKNLAKTQYLSSSNYIVQEPLNGIRLLVNIGEYYGGNYYAGTNEQMWVYQKYYSDVYFFNVWRTGQLIAIRAPIISNKYFNVNQFNLWRRFASYTSPNTSVDFEYKLDLLDNNMNVIVTIDNGNSVSPMELAIGYNRASCLYLLGSNDPQTGSGDSIYTTQPAYVKIYERYKLSPLPPFYTKTLKVITNCKDDGYYVYFLTEFNWEHYYFPHFKFIHNTKRDTLMLSKDYVNQPFKHETHVEINDDVTLELKSDIIDDDNDYKLLAYILTSPKIYINKASDLELHEVVLTTNNYSVNQILYGKLEQVTFNLKYTRINAL